jgi:hypothetical protein
MRSLLTFVCAAATATLAGCATGTSGSSTGAVRLPAGVTLLESDQDRCSGVVHLDEGSVRSSREIAIRPGQDAAFRVESDRIEWTCIGETTTNSDAVECPDRTAYVRITRPPAGEEFLVECYSG